MQKIVKLASRAWAAVGISLVLFHTACLVIGGINRLVAGPEYNTIDRVAGNFLTATGTIQRWNMFSPNVGDTSYAPVLVIALDDGRRVLWNSPATPVMVDLPDERFFDYNLQDSELAMHWMVHVNDGRRRKLDSRIIDPVSDAALQRTTYARWMLQQFMAQHPEEASGIAAVDLHEYAVVHNGGEPVPRRGSQVHYIFIYPQLDPLWPQGIRPSVEAPPLP